jgi:hypothetical protein
MNLVYKYKKAYKKAGTKKRNLFQELLFFPINFYLFINEKVLSERLSIILTFKRIFGFFPDFKNPKTLNEKLQWKKLYDRRRIYTLCADKYAVRDYIEKKVGAEYLVPLLLYTADPEKIDFSSLPDTFVVKANHGYGMTYFVDDKSKADVNQIRKVCRKWLKTDFYKWGREWQYKDIKRKILIQEMLIDDEGNIPADYKFHCFNGNVKFIQVDTDRFGNHQRTMYWPDWTLGYFNWCEEKEFGDDPANDVNPRIKKPKAYDKMIELSERLSKDFDYVRVDLYDVKGKIYFGELTFGHGAGYLIFFPKTYDRIFGDMLKIGKKKR